MPTPATEGYVDVRAQEVRASTLLELNASWSLDAVDNHGRIRRRRSHRERHLIDNVTVLALKVQQPRLRQPGG